MTSSAAPLSPEGFKAFRTTLAFATREEPHRRRPPAFVRLRLSTATATVAALAVIGVLTDVALDRSAPPPPPVAPVAPVVTTPSPPAWTEVIHPFTTYDLAGSPFAKLPLAYAARRDAAGTARQDTLTYGSPVPGEAFLRLMFYRRGDEPATATTVFVDAARLAAGVGLAVTRSGLTSTLATRFGAFEVAGVAVAAPARSATCLAFRLAEPGSAAVLQIGGLACGTDERPVDLASLACALEKIDLVSAGDDEDLRAVFVAAERRRGLGCREDRGAGLRPGFPDEVRPVRSALKGAL